MTASDLTTETDAPTRSVLLVENDPVQCRDHADCLEGWGYIVIVARADPGDGDFFNSLRRDAIQKAREHQCRIALIDLRLKSDNDLSDVSGLELAQELGLSFTMIMSAYEKPHHMQNPDICWGFWGKAESPQSLKDMLDESVVRVLDTL